MRKGAETDMELVIADPSTCSYFRRHLELVNTLSGKRPCVRGDTLRRVDAYSVNHVHMLVPIHQPKHFQLRISPRFIFVICVSVDTSLTFDLDIS